MRKLAFHEINQVAGAELEEMPMWRPPVCQDIQLLHKIAETLAPILAGVGLPIAYSGEYALD